MKKASKGSPLRVAGKSGRTSAIDLKLCGVLLLSLLTAAIPALMSMWMLSTESGGALRSYAPQWSDEVYNWHQAATFSAVGFDGGYYTAYEKPAPLAFTHFYSHGPVYPVLLGLLGRSIGWELYSTPVLNVVLVTLALLYFIILTRPGIRQLLFLGLVMASCWPLQLYLLTDMRVAFFSAMAIVLAALFERTISDPDRPSGSFLAIFAGFIVLASVSKLTWSFLFFPYFLHIRERLHLSAVQALAASTGLGLASFGLYNVLAAPYPNFANDLMAEFGLSLTSGVAMLLEHIWLSLRNFFDWDHRFLWLMLRLQILITLGWASFVVWKRASDLETWWDATLLLASSGSLVVLTILLYDVFGWRDFRLFGPPLLLSSLVFVARQRFLLLSVLLVGNLLVLPDFLAAQSTIFTHGRFSENHERLEAFVEEIAPVVQFDGGAGGWENTILVPLSVAIDPLIIGIPAGVGISWFKFPERLSEVKSRYAILDLRSYQTLDRRTRLRFVKSTLMGDLYMRVSETPNSEGR